MNNNQTALCAILGAGVIVALYFAVSNDPNTAVVPQKEGEYQFMGLGGSAGASLKLGDETPLDLRTHVHFWDPGMNPRDANPPCGVITTPHRYPTMSGGNISNVMHNGWASVINNSPDNDWFTTPPEAAVL